MEKLPIVHIGFTAYCRFMTGLYAPIDQSEPKSKKQAGKKRKKPRHLPPRYCRILEIDPNRHQPEDPWETEALVALAEGEAAQEVIVRLEDLQPMHSYKVQDRPVNFAFPLDWWALQVSGRVLFTVGDKVTFHGRRFRELTGHVPSHSVGYVTAIFSEDGMVGVETTIIIPGKAPEPAIIKVQPDLIRHAGPLAEPWGEE